MIQWCLWPGGYLASCRRRLRPESMNSAERLCNSGFVVWIDVATKRLRNDAFDDSTGKVDVREDMTTKASSSNAGVPHNSEPKASMNDFV